MNENNTALFGKWRAFFWPIHRLELKKFLPMFFMFFLISFNYNALRACKDSLVVTAPHSGAEAIPFIKVWAILPGALLLTFLFTRLSNHFSREKVFYIMMCIFIGFFILFTFVLFPAQDYIHPNKLADKMQAILPEGFKGLIAMFRNWTFTLFYVMSELWGTAILTVLFWGFANEVTRVDEAKRFYGLLMIGANLAGIISGIAAVALSSNYFLEFIPYGKTSWDQSMLFLNCLIIASGVGTIAIFRWFNRHVISPVKKNMPPPEKIKMSLRKNFAHLAKSKYLLCLAFIVFTYNISVNLIEIVWKNQIKQVYPNPSEYNLYMGEVMILMGVIATLSAIVIVFALNRFSWTFNAMVPATIMLFTGGCFFLFVLFPNSGLNWIAAAIGSTPLMLSVSLGGIQNCLTRAAKYTVFDATKEIAFIPLDPESKLKGKAAIDGVGSRFGKSGGAIIHQSLLLVFSTVGATTPYVAGAFLIVVLIWVGSVFSLGKQFDQLTKPAPDGEPLLYKN